MWLVRTIKMNLGEEHKKERTQEKKKGKKETK